MWAGIVAAYLTIGGCVVVGPAPTVSGVREPVSGHWESLDAAVAFAARGLGLTVLRRIDEPITADTRTLARVYEFLSVLDATPVLRAEGENRSAESAVVRLEAAWRPVRDAQREAALIDSIRRRLLDLKAGGGIVPR